MNVVRGPAQSLRLEESARIPTIGQVMLRIVIIVSLAEILIMFFLGSTNLKIGNKLVALLDGVLLLGLCSVPVYLWVIRPFARAYESSARHVAHLAYHDALTDLPNRRLLFEHLAHALAACRRHRVYGALLLVDLDGFKQVNDAYGHDSGDALLKEIGSRLRANMREEDIVGRLGGDEFLVLAQQLDVQREAAVAKVEALARNLKQSLAAPMVFEGNHLQVESSIGIRMLGLEQQTVAATVRQADEAMYRAKTDLRGSIVMHQDRRPPCAQELAVSSE